MNKIYKVVWNKARNCYVVASEFAKNHSTSSVSKKSASAVLLAVTVLLSGGVSVYADNNLAPTITKIEIGQDATATGQNGVAIGSGTEASGLDSIAIGGNTKATGDDSIAIGDDTTAKGMYSVAIGDDIHFTGVSATAVGQQAHATGNVSTAIGTMTNVDADYNFQNKRWRIAGEQSTAIGAYAGSWGLASTAVGGYSKAEGRLATAVGYHSQANVDYGTALGDYSEVKAGWGVAIGASSVADRESGVVGAFAPEGADSLTWKANAGAVSVGSETITRQITNVAAGTEATDAVNVGQLKEVGEVAANANKGWNLSTNGVATEATNVAPGEIVDFNGDKNISVSHDKTKVNVELNKNLKDIETISNGGATLTLGAMGGMVSEFANGQGASVKLFGDTTTINGKVNVYKDGRIAGVADGVNANDAVNVGQLKNSAWKLAANGVLTEAEDVKAGDYVDFNGDQNVSVSKDAKDGVKTVKIELNKDLTGIETISNGDAKLTLGGFTTELTNGQGASVKLFGDTTTINNAVTVYKDGRIAGVAAGINDNDAVNVSQLKAVGATANMGWNLATNGVATEATNVKPGDYVDFSGDKNISVSHDGTKVQVELNKDIDVNYVQTNALNSKYNLSVGTMAENGIMPFFVNSTGAFYAANNNFSVDKDGKVTATAGEIGNVVLNNGVFYKNSALRDGELFIGDNDGNYSQITTKGAKLGQVVIAADGKISNVAAGVADTDAVNVGQLKEAVEAGNTDTHIKPGEYGVGADNTVNMDVVDKNGNKIDTVTIKDVAKASDVGNVNSIAADLKNKEGKTTVVDAVNNLNNKVGDLQYSKVEKGEIADGDSTTTAIGKLDQKLTDVAATAAKHTKVEGSSNITVTNTAKEGEAANYKVELNKDIDVDTVKATTVTTGQTVMNNDGLKVGTDVSVTATAVTAGQTSINNEGLAVGPNTSLKADELKVDGKTYIDKNGLNANGMKITNVADGKENSDAVNVGQLKESEKTINNRIDGVENQVVNNTNRINKLGSRVNKVGAGAAALAALHPMDFDPDDKLTFSAGYGNYAGENAAAIGAYYRPDEKVMFSVAGTVGNGENMVNAGVSFALDRTNHVSNSRTALAREVIDLRGQLAVMGAKMAKMEKAFGMLDETKTKLFPDVPANHWAYEYIAKLAGNGYIEGYPDGNFGGDRLMTRYEFAAMLYRAIENGAALEEKIIKEFEPELGRIRVDRISGEDGDRDKIERVRVNDTKGERDHYGNKLAK